MNRRLMMSQHSKGLPTDYRRLLYIKAKDGVYLNTGVVGDEFTSAEYQIELASIKPYGPYMLSSEGFMASPFLRRPYGEYSLSVFRGSKVSVPYVFSAKTVYKLAIDEEGDVFLNDEFMCAVGNVHLDYTEENKYMFFGTYYGDKDNPDYHINGKIYYCKIFQNGKMVRDFVPCLNPEGIAGMYDLVEGEFYKSATNINYEAGEVA